jgi:DNA-binding response OmpR family regulator
MILVVDDNADIGRFLCRLLKVKGYPCEWASDGATGLGRIRAYPSKQPLLVVLDEMMPHLSGMDVLQQLRSDPATERTAVLMYTAGIDLAKQGKAMALSALAWLYKGDGTAVDEIIHWYERVGGVKRQ